MVKIINPMYGSDPIASAFSGIGKRLFAGPDAPSVQEMMWKREEKYRDEAIKAASDIAWQQANPGLHAQLQFEQGMSPDWYSTAGATTSALTDPRYEGDPTSAYLIGGGQGAASPHFMDIDDAAAQQAEALRLAETIRNNNMTDATSQANNAATIAGAMERQNADPLSAVVGGKPAFVPKGGAFAPGVAPPESETDMRGRLIAPLVEDPAGDLAAAKTDDQLLLLGADRGENQPAQQVYDEYYALAIAQGYPPDQAKTFAMTQAAKRSGMKLSVGGDGTTIDFSNIGLPGGPSSSTTAQLQQMEVGFNEFQSLIQTTLPFVRDPKNFGVTGNIQYMAQQLGQVMQNIGLTTGSDVTNEVLSTFTGAEEFLNNTDPSLRALQSLRILLAYAAAKANGSVGRDLSDPEIQMNMQTIGDPTDWLTSQDSFLTALGTVDYTMRAKRNARVPVDQRTPLPDSLTYVKQFVAAAKAGAPMSSATPGAPTPDAPTGAPVRKQFKGPDGLPHWFELIEGAWKQVD
jgi:hypothetical protein